MKTREERLFGLSALIFAIGVLGSGATLGYAIFELGYFWDDFLHPSRTVFWCGISSVTMLLAGKGGMFLSMGILLKDYPSAWLEDITGWGIALCLSSILLAMISYIVKNDFRPINEVAIQAWGIAMWVGAYGVVYFLMFFVAAGFINRKLYGN